MNKRSAFRVSVVVVQSVWRGMPLGGRGRSVLVCWQTLGVCPLMSLSMSGFAGKRMVASIVWGKREPSFGPQKIASCFGGTSSVWKVC